MFCSSEPVKSLREAASVTTSATPLPASEIPMPNTVGAAPSSGIRWSRKKIRSWLRIQVKLQIRTVSNETNYTYRPALEGITDCRHSATRRIFYSDSSERRRCDCRSSWRGVWAHHGSNRSQGCVREGRLLPRGCRVLWQGWLLWRSPQGGASNLTPRGPAELLLISLNHKNEVSGAAPKA